MKADRYASDSAQLDLRLHRLSDLNLQRCKNAGSRTATQMWTLSLRGPARPLLVARPTPAGCFGLVAVKGSSFSDYISGHSCIVSRYIIQCAGFEVLEVQKNSQVFRFRARRLRRRRSTHELEYEKEQLW